MKEFLIKKGQAVAALIPLFNAILLTAVFMMAISQREEMQTIKSKINQEDCSFFINIAEYSKGSVEYFCTASDYKSMKQIELEYKHQIQAQSVSQCQYGQCLDSVQISLFRDCTNNYDIEIYRDTTIRF